MSLPDSEPVSRALLVCGVPASGKTAFGRTLAAELGWALLDLDTVTNPLYEFVGGDFAPDVPTEFMPTRASVNDIRYQCLFDTAAENLEIGMSVVLVAPFTSERTFASYWATVPQRLRVDDDRVDLAWVDTPAAEVVQRMIRRGADRDTDKIENPSVFLTDDVTRAPGVDHFRVNGLLSTAEQVEAFIADYPPLVDDLAARAAG